MQLFRRKAPESRPLGLEELTISLENLDAGELLSEWRWLVDESFSPVLLSAVGDLFVQGQDGTIWWLCTGTGQFTQVAPDLAEFQRLTTQPEPSREWFLPDIVGHFRKAGVVLPAGYCYSYKHPPFLGCKREPKNFGLTPVHIHFAFLGEVYYQVKDLPPGTKIRHIQLLPS